MRLVSRRKIEIDYRAAPLLLAVVSEQHAYNMAAQAVSSSLVHVQHAPGKGDMSSCALSKLRLITSPDLFLSRSLLLPLTQQDYLLDQKIVHYSGLLCPELQ